MAENVKKKFETFLKKYSVDKTKPYTHTKIPDKELNIYGGKYNIPKEKCNEFYKLYIDYTIKAQKLEFLTEKQNEIGPVMIDLDFRYDSDIFSK